MPEVASSGYAGATVRHLLDMRTGVAFSEKFHALELAQRAGPREAVDTIRALGAVGAQLSVV